MPIWIAALLLVFSLVGILLLAKHKKTGNKKDAISMLLLCGITLALISYLLLSVILLSSVAT